MASGGIVYVVSPENLIISQFECDFNVGVFEYMGKTDGRGNRYIVSVIEKDPPFPYKKKPLFDRRNPHSLP